MAEELTKRKLTAILSADVKGYSRLMQDDEEATVRTISAYREVMTDLIDRQNGRVVDAKGDNLLAEFPSVVDAVRCAVMIQKELKAKNNELPENRKMKFRIGINLGDVIEDKETIYGDGVNIAARLEGLAEGGGICISRMAFDSVKNKLDVGYEHLGEHSVKNIVEPVRVYKVLTEPEYAGKVIGEERPKPKQWRFATVASAVVLMVVAAVFIYWQLTLHKTQPADDRADLRKAYFPLADKPSIAVLPFENMTGDPQQQYLCDGMAEQLISGLSQGPYIYVIARTSSFAYRGKSMTAQQIANELGVRYLIEGSVQRDSERVRVNVQLIDGRNEKHIWAEHYDQKYENLFALQDQITMAVMAFLNVKITGYVIGGEKDFRPSNLKAYEYYLRGLYYHLGRSPKDLLPARQALEEAINLDPNFGAAYAWLGHVFIDEIYFRKTKSPGKVLERAEKLANKALSISPSHGYGLLSAISRLRKNFDNAILYGEKCRDQRPHDSGPHFMLGMALSVSERFEEAISSLETALQLAPFRPLNYLTYYGWSLNGNKQYDKAIPVFTEIIERSQSKRRNYSAYKGLTAAYELSGNHEKARWAAENVLRINPKFSIAAEKKKSSAREGDFKKRMFDAYRRAGLPE